MKKLLFLTEKAERIIVSTAKINKGDDFLLTPWGDDVFDATVMRFQIVGEMMKQIDMATKGEMLIHYPEIPWRNIFGLRNLISHEYSIVDPVEIFNTVKEDIPLLVDVLHRIADDINAGKHDALFRQRC